MSNYDFQSNPEGEGEEGGYLAWNEFDWERFLRDQEGFIRHYQELYLHFESHPDRIDLAAQLMGWNACEWAGSDFLDGDDDSEGFDDDDPDEDDCDDIEPYTLHQHPIYIATKALYAWLQARWLDLACNNSGAPVDSAARYQASLHMGEANAISAIHALDMADYALAICLFKRALADINRAFHCLEALTKGHTESLLRYRRDAKLRLFDLRNISLRVMQYCREEVNRRIRGDE